VLIYKSSPEEGMLQRIKMLVKKVRKRLDTGHLKW